MQPGQVIIIRNYKTHDGKILTKPKFFVILADYKDYFLTAIATSQGHKHAYVPGCFSGKYFSFYIPQGEEPQCFPEHTWVQLDQIHRLIGIPPETTPKDFLSNSRYRDLLVCAANSDDIPIEEAEFLNQISFTLR